MNKKTILTISKSVIIILILLAAVFALRVPAADLNSLPNDVKGDYVDAQGLPYFSEMDSYYNLRLTENFVDHGHAGDEVVNGSVMDMHRYAPDGGELNYELGIVYVTDFLNDIANMFGSYSVKEVAFWTGAIISSLAVIPAYIFARRLTNDYGAITAALIIGLAPNYFAHTFPGFFDTDMFYYIFSLFFILFFMECLKSDNLIYKIIFAVLSILSIGLFSMSWTGYVFYVALMGLYAVIYLIASFVLKIGNDHVEDYPSRLSWFVHQKDFLSVVLVLVIGFIGLAILRGFDGVTGIFSQVFGLLNLQSASVVIGGFPNVLISVAEMQMPALLGSGMGSAFLANTSGAVNGIGGILVLFAGLIVLYALIVRLWNLRSAKVKDTSKKPPKSERKSAAEKIDAKYKFKFSLGDLGNFTSSEDLYTTKRITLMYGLLFIIWTIVACLAVSRGSRFITTLALPFGLMAGIAVGYLVDYIKANEIKDKFLMAIIVLGGFFAAFPLVVINMTYGILLFAVIIVLGAIFIYAKSNVDDLKKLPLKKYLAVIVVVLALVSPSVCGAYQTADHVVPGTSDPMWNAMTWIDENMPEDTVITSWWDFGYLFEIAADRQVTFDGGSQSGERAFWLGQAMTTDNLELSAGIFRMLDTTGDRAVDALDEINGGNTSQTTSILIDILPMTASDAKNTLINTYHLTDAQANEVVSYTHPENPRPVIFVASSDMLQKAGWWTYFGQWDFEKQNSTNYQYYLPTSEVTVEPGQSAKVNMLNESGMAINVVIDRGTGNNTTTADIETTYASNGSQIMINGSEYNPLNASRLVIVEDGQMVKNESINGSNGNYTLFLMGVGNTYTPIIMSSILENSMFTRLYLEGGFGQNIFTQVHSEEGVSLWQVNFNNTAAGGASTSTNSTN